MEKILEEKEKELKKKLSKKEMTINHKLYLYSLGKKEDVDKLPCILYNDNEIVILGLVDVISKFNLRGQHKAWLVCDTYRILKEKNGNFKFKTKKLKPLDSYDLLNCKIDSDISFEHYNRGEGFDFTVKGMMRGDTPVYLFRIDDNTFDEIKKEVELGKNENCPAINKLFEDVQTHPETMSFYKPKFDEYWKLKKKIEKLK